MRQTDFCTYRIITQSMGVDEVSDPLLRWIRQFWWFGGTSQIVLDLSYHTG